MGGDEHVAPRSHPPPGLRLGAVHLSVADLDRSVAWYRARARPARPPPRGGEAALGDGDGETVARAARGPARRGPPAATPASTTTRCCTRTPRGARPRRRAPVRDAHADRGRLRPRHPRGDLPPRPRRQRHRAGRRPPARAVARPTLGYARRPAAARLRRAARRRSRARSPPRRSAPGLRIGPPAPARRRHRARRSPSTATCSASRSWRPRPSAAFVSAGGYHHHLGFNVWRGARRRRRRPTHTVGLRHWTLVLPGRPTSPPCARASRRPASRSRTARGGLPRPRPVGDRPARHDRREAA